MKLQIHVTQLDINKASDGQGHRCFVCPTALAMYRTTGVKWGVGHSEAWPYWAKWQEWMPNEIYVPLVHYQEPILLPQEAIEFEQKYDEETVGFPFTLTIKPYSFEIEVPDWMVV